MDLSKILNKCKKEQFPWMYEVTKSAPHEALKDLDGAFKNFFNIKTGFPKFKSKHNLKQSFKIEAFYCKFNPSSMSIPKIGQVRLKEKDYVPTNNVHYNSVTVSKKADRWFASVQCEVEMPEPKKPEIILGIDVGIKTLATCSNGQVFKNNKYLKKSEKKLTHAQRSLSRKVKGSQKFNRSKLKIQKIYQTISNKRRDQIHKMTSALVKTKPRYLALENLNVQGMIKNHSLALSLSDASFGEIHRQFLYKTLWYGGKVINVDRFFPSSRKCRVCGNVKSDLTLSDRVYICDQCGHVEDRDLNASKNLESWGISTLSSRGIKACGESVRPDRSLGLQAISEKQEENVNSGQLCQIL